MQIYFKQTNGKSLAVEVEASDTVAILKDKLRVAAGYDHDVKVRVICAGKILEDDRTLSDYNIQKDSNCVNYSVTFENIPVPTPTSTCRIM